MMHNACETGNPITEENGARVGRLFSRLRDLIQAMQICCKSTVLPHTTVSPGTLRLLSEGIEDTMPVISEGETGGGNESLYRDGRIGVGRLGQCGHEPRRNPSTYDYYAAWWGLLFVRLERREFVFKRWNNIPAVDQTGMWLTYLPRLAFVPPPLRARQDGVAACASSYWFNVSGCR